ncbi:vacuolar protein sorting-associated protein 52 A-like [Phalaenopsis equestris]|uniref:vacuolar protein sorting-associated protein 52 A-like n=1 Tax=Phalaenopsis equestris TaxID=78828 RepID=UPI0009E5AC17|nr:vacuolar protein sorting-associated protein 52 A-like [Phalaenopsis equestris]
MVSLSSAEAKYRALALGICEGMWIKKFLKELGIMGENSIKMFCDNQAAISIANILTKTLPKSSFDELTNKLDKLTRFQPFCYNQEELLLEHFGELIKFVKNRALEETSSSIEKSAVSDVEPLVKDFASRWKNAIELMHRDVITSFSNFLCGMDILKAALTQLLLYYTRLSESVKKIAGGSVLNKDLVSISSILYEIKKYSRTF